METGRASKTALRVALRRAVHQVLDRPCVFTDPIAVPLLGPQFKFDPIREKLRVSRAFRAFMAARSRYAEDRLAESVAQGVTQYVVLGAGLDTFAWRNPFPHLRVFEVDFPATQDLEARNSFPKPPCPSPPASPLFRSILSTRRSPRGFPKPDSMPPDLHSSVGSASCPISRSQPFEPHSKPSRNSLPAQPSASTTASRRIRSASSIAWLSVRWPGAWRWLENPSSSSLHPRSSTRSWRAPDFAATSSWIQRQLNELYFSGRADGLKLPSPGLGKLATAWA